MYPLDVCFAYATISKSYEQFYQNSGGNCDRGLAHLKGGRGMIFRCGLK